MTVFPESATPADIATVTAGSQTINGSGRRSEACTDRSPIVLTRSVRARIGGNPHPAARSEHDWKVAAYLMPARKCSVFRDTKTRIRPETLRTQVCVAGKPNFSARDKRPEKAPELKAWRSGDRADL